MAGLTVNDINIPKNINESAKNSVNLSISKNHFFKKRIQDTNECNKLFNYYQILITYRYIKNNT